MAIIIKPRGVFSSSGGAGDAIFTNPNCRGALIRVGWAELEPSPNVFNFTAIAQEVDNVHANNSQFSLAISAGGTGSPDWLIDVLHAPYIDYTFRLEPKRLPLLWSPVVKHRLRNLASHLSEFIGTDDAFRLLYIPQMTANGIEGHLNGVNMTNFVAAGYTDQKWIDGSMAVARMFARAFPGVALAFEVHDIDDSASVPIAILDAIESERCFQGRVGAGMWWIRGTTAYQPELIDALTAFQGDIYGQVIGRSDDTDRFPANPASYEAVFAQAKQIGLRYIEPWEFELKPPQNQGTAPDWDYLFADFNVWADGAQGDLKANNRNGQTFLTWTITPASSNTYKIYRSTAPITQASHLNAGNLLGTAGANPARNDRLSSIVGGDHYYRIDSGAPLNNATGLFVATTVTNGVYYYAVTTVIGGIEDTNLVSGQNTLANGINELVAEVLPVWQEAILYLGNTKEVYTHWSTAIASTLYPAMTNKNSVAWSFAVNQKGATGPFPLLVSLHAHGGNFMAALSHTQSQTNELAVSFDAPHPDTTGGFWYGYQPNYADLTVKPNLATPPASGVIQDYEVRRIEWALDWVLATHNVNANQVYLQGTSVGGIGATFLAIALRDKIAAVFTKVPKFDFSFLGDPNSANQWNSTGLARAEGNGLWGTVATGLQCNDGIQVYDRLDMNDMIQAYEGDTIPFQVAFNGKNDTIVGWAEKIGYYQSVDTYRRGGIYFWDQRIHGGTGQWTPEEGFDILYRFRLNRTWPALSFCSANEDPGNGFAAVGDAYGMINGHLDWGDDMIDTAGQYEITIRLVTRAGQTGIVDPPASAEVDITPRRVQLFPIVTGDTYHWQNIANAGAGSVVASGDVVADSLGLITIQAFLVSSGNGNRLVIT